MITNNRWCKEYYWWGKLIYKKYGTFLQISEWYKGKRRLKSKMEIDPATQVSSRHIGKSWILFEIKSSDFFYCQTKIFLLELLQHLVTFFIIYPVNFIALFRNIQIHFNLVYSIICYFQFQGDAGIYECHANNKWSVDMRSFRTDYNIFFD